MNGRHRSTRGAVANFIKENIITRFGVPHRVISDNKTPFVSKEVKKNVVVSLGKASLILAILPIGEWQTEATNKTLIKIISILSHE